MVVLLLLQVLLLSNVVTSDAADPVVTSDAADPVVKTRIRLGNVLGSVKEYNGKKFSSFAGIRYAKPPIKKLRFLPPEPLEEPWINDWVNFSTLLHHKSSIKIL